MPGKGPVGVRPLLGRLSVLIQTHDDMPGALGNGEYRMVEDR